MLHLSRRSLLALLAAAICHAASRRKTAVSISQDQFRINGKPTYKGRTFQGKKVEGLLFNARMVQGIFDDQNPETSARWAYPDTGKWDADATRANSSLPCRSGGDAGCLPSRSICKVEAPKDTRANSPGLPHRFKPMAHYGWRPCGGWRGFWTGPTILA